MGEHGDPLQCSCLENPMDRGTWRATGHGVEKTKARLKPFSTRLAWLPGLSSLAWKGGWGAEGGPGKGSRCPFLPAFLRLIAQGGRAVPPRSEIIAASSHRNPAQSHPGPVSTLCYS